jgi:hypothetical protein
MTNRLSRPVRFLTLLLAAMQFAVPAVVSVVDGTVARSARESGTHIEAFGDNQCKPPHSADCAICRFLSTTHGQVGTPVAAVVLTKIAPPPTTLVALAGTAARHGFDSRAPPIS